jgi:ADP-ribosyl-[dinitrogen reductase] hydrolase
MPPKLQSATVRTAVYGHLVGDAIGVPYEGSHASEIGTVELRGYGAHNQPPGTWSDDGALMLALLDSLKHNGFDPEDQGRRFLDWADRGAYTPDGTVFDIGGATGRALARLRAGTRAIDAGGTDDNDCGNGSLMRILPIALLDPKADAATLVERACLSSRVTHGHPRCQVACALYVLIARALLDGERDRSAALDASVSRLRELSTPAHASALAELMAWTGRSGRGFVVDSFWSAWDAFALSGSYRETIQHAVGYGHDTDTTAAIAGGLAGLYWGADEEAGGIPAEWLRALRGKELVEEILAMHASTTGPPPRPGSW